MLTSVGRRQPRQVLFKRYVSQFSILMYLLNIMYISKQCDSYFGPFVFSFVYGMAALRVTLLMPNHTRKAILK